MVVGWSSAESDWFSRTTELVAAIFADARVWVSKCMLMGHGAVCFGDIHLILFGSHVG